MSRNFSKETELDPFDPSYKPKKSLAQLAAEHPEAAGLQQLAFAEKMGVLPQFIAGQKDAWDKVTSSKDR